MATKQNKRFQRWRHWKTIWQLWWPSWISDRHSLSYFWCRGHPVATLCFNLNHPRVWVEKSKTGFQDGGYGGHFGFPIGMILAIFIYMSTCCCIVSFNLICLVVCKMSKTDFQDGSCGGHLGFLINTILAHFDPEVVLLLQSKFRLKLTKDLGKDVENWFSRWRLWWQSWIFNWLSFSYFVSTRHPNAPHQVSTQLDHCL